MPMPEPITSPNMPKALGPYSHAVRVGDLLFVAGQSGINPATGTAPDEFEPQARQAFQNLATVLDAAGSSLGHVAKTTVFLTDAANFPKMNDLYAEFFPTNPPVRSTPIVQLPRGLLISIECIAAIA
ncbi:MAG: Rid family detoxifying hydrolase [Chloroflexota bacterium]